MALTMVLRLKIDDLLRVLLRCSQRVGKRLEDFQRVTDRADRGDGESVVSRSEASEAEEEMGPHRRSRLKAASYDEWQEWQARFGGVPAAELAHRLWHRWRRGAA